MSKPRPRDYDGAVDLAEKVTGLPVGDRVIAVIEDAYREAAAERFDRKPDSFNGEPSAHALKTLGRNERHDEDELADE